MPKRRKIYLAGPEVFLTDAIAIGTLKKELCDQFGFEGLFPLDNDPPDPVEDRLDRGIYRANVAMMETADAGIFNLTPFRGPSADVGTVFELGLMTGYGKPTFGYTNEADDLLSRTRRDQVVTIEEGGSAWRDPNAMLVEDWGNADNLMLDASLAEQGRVIVRHAVTAAERFRDVQGFIDCLKLAQEHFAAIGARPRRKLRRIG